MVVCGNPINIPWEGQGWMLDCSAAIENMMIAATTIGLGSVWIGGFDDASIKRLLGIPDHVIPMSIVYFGYPAEIKKPGTRYNDEAVFWQKYDAQRKRQLRTMGMKYDLTTIE